MCFRETVKTSFRSSLMDTLIYEFFTTFETKLLFFRFYRVQQIKFAFVDEVDDEFSEKRVGPGEP